MGIYRWVVVLHERAPVNCGDVWVGSEFQRVPQEVSVSDMHIVSWHRGRSFLSSVRRDSEHLELRECRLPD